MAEFWGEIPDINTAENDPNADGVSFTPQDGAGGADWWSRAEGAVGRFLDYKLKSDEMDLQSQRINARIYSGDPGIVGGQSMSSGAFGGNSQLMTLMLFGLAAFVAIKLLKD